MDVTSGPDRPPQSGQAGSSDAERINKLMAECFAIACQSSELPYVEVRAALDRLIDNRVNERALATAGLASEALAVAPFEDWEQVLAECVCPGDLWRPRFTVCQSGTLQGLVLRDVNGDNARVELLSMEDAVREVLAKYDFDQYAILARFPTTHAIDILAFLQRVARSDDKPHAETP